MEKRAIKQISLFLAVLFLFTAPVPCSPAGSPRELFNRGVDELKTGNPQTAVDLFTELIITEPVNANVYKNRGVALLKLGKVDPAIQDFEKALETDPDLPGIYSNLGAAWYYKQAYEKAVINYGYEIERAPKGHISYFNRALSRIKLNQQKLAMVDIERCLELKSDFPEALALQKTMKGFEIQTGAFLNQKNAVEMVGLLKQKGMDAHIITMEDHEEKTWYLVRFELFTDHGKAGIFCKQFLEREKMTAIVRPWGGF